MQASKYRKKPVIIEAMPFDGSMDSIRSICLWANRDTEEPVIDYVFGTTIRPCLAYMCKSYGYHSNDLIQPDCGGTGFVACSPEEPYDIFVHTLEGEMRVNSGDWIIRGIKGEFYPCKPDIFEATYEAVDAGE